MQKNTTAKRPISMIEEERKISKEETSFEPPDGGWGWAVCAACFYCNLVVAGMANTFGLFLIPLSDYYKFSIATSALSGSIFNGITFLACPLVSALINRFDCRSVCIFGGCLRCFAFIAGSFAPNTGVFFALFSFLGGLSGACCYVPANILCNFYFKRKRALASSIAASGASLGSFGLSPLISYLLTIHDWKITFIVLGVISSGAIIAGILMLPLEASIVLDDNHIDDPIYLESEDTPNFESQQVPITLSIDIEPKLPSKLHPGNSQIGKRKVSVQISPFSQSDIHYFASAIDVPSKNNDYSFETKRKHSIAGSLMMNKEFGNEPCIRRKSRHIPEIQNIPSQRRQSTIMLPLTYHNNLYQHPETGIPSLHVEDLTVKSQENKKLERNYGKNYQDQDEFINSLPTADEYDPSFFETMLKKHFVSNGPSILPSILGLSKLCNVRFFIMILGSILVRLAMFIPFNFLPSMIKSTGDENAITDSEIAWLFSVINVSICVGGIGTGLLVDLTRINVIVIANIGRVALAAAVVGYLFCPSYPGFVATSSAFGLGFGTYTSTLSLLMVEVFGIDSLTLMFGIMSFFNGIASIVGPPIAGVIIGLTNEYDTTFYVSGLIFTLSAITGQILHLLHSKCNNTTK